jgi:glucose/arabinose dehydrogenase
MELSKHKGLCVVTLFSSLVVASCGGGSSSNNNPPPPPPVVVGLDARPDNATCIAPAKAAAGVSVDVADVFPALPTIGSPTKILLEPVANPRWFVLRKSGQLVVFDPANATSTANFLDLSGVVRTASEGGLLGMAFHPDYPAVPEVFLSYTINGPSTEMRSVISRFILDNVTSPGAGTVEQIIIEIDQFASNHNGGDIAFGSDRLLYVGLGDGGGGGDPQETGQDTRRLLGSMLRIGVIGTGADYTIPGNNPFPTGAKCGPGSGNTDNCPEIYAWGLRNPWRWSFDQPTGVLWLADVGQNA